MRMKMFIGGVVTATITGVGVVVSATPASAVTRNCNATTARMCIHYNSKELGYQAEFGSDYNIKSFNPGKTSDPAVFKAGSKGSAGAAYWVWNNAASLRNLGNTVRVGVFQDSDYGGAGDIFPIGASGNLVHTKNDNASMAWGY